MSKFQEQLRVALEEQGLSIYGLARLLDPRDPSRAERNIYRWLAADDPTLPSRASREALAEALGRPPDFFRKGSELPVLEQMARNFTVRLREYVA